MNFDSHIPLHVQLKDLIKGEIVEGKYEEKIPSERELMERFSVSRSTVREAVSHLVQDGILKKIHGKGTFITKNKTVQDWLNTLNSFTETVNQMGMKPGARLLSSNELHYFEVGSKIFGEQPIYSIARLRTADNLPIAIERHYYERKLGLQISKYNLNKATIYDVIEKDLNITIVEAEQTIRCCSISVEDAELLGLQPNINVLCIERVITGENQQIIEYYQSLLHPELYMLKLNTKRAIRGVN